MKASKLVSGDVAWQWLQLNPAPIRSSDMAAWSARVCEELTVAALPELMRLLEQGDDEQQLPSGGRFPRARRGGLGDR